MAAAVYLHNALFSHSSTVSPGHPSQPASDSSSPSPRSTPSDEYHDAQEDQLTSNENADIRADHGHDSVEQEQRDRADISTSSASLSAPAPSTSAPVSVPPLLQEETRNTFLSANTRDHTRKSSETTLVPFVSPLYSRSRGPLLSPPSANLNVQHMPSQRNGDYNTRGGDAYPNQQQEEGYVDIPLASDSELPPRNNPNATVQQPSPPDRHSPLPPGLPATTLSTSRYQPTPYPFPPIGSNPPSHFRSSSTSAVEDTTAHRTRPKGRRRPLQPSLPPNNNPNNNNNTTADILRNSPIGRLIRKGRRLNRNLSRPTRIAILFGRGLLTALLCGWAAYSCARYWLAYSEFRPSPSSEDGPIPKEDPPRSQYAFALAITSSIATGFLAIDILWFLYFVLYPLELRPPQRTPTIAPINRDESNAPPNVPSTSNPTSTDIDDPTKPKPRQQSKTDNTNTTKDKDKENDNYTAIPNRTSVYSNASSSRRQSRRLSKTSRPNSWAQKPENWAPSIGYPPVPMPPGLGLDPRGEVPFGLGPSMPIGGGEQPEHAEEQVREELRQPERPSQEIIEVLHPHQRDVGDDTRPSSQYVSGDEAPPQVSRQDRSTYMLHLPISCQDGNISPLPMLPSTSADPAASGSNSSPSPPAGQNTAAATTTATAIGSGRPDATSSGLVGGTNTVSVGRGTSRAQQQVAKPRRKWKWSRRTLHAIHWVAFIGLNIPGIINVGLIPRWFDPMDSGYAGINSPHRLSGLCRWSPDVTWAGSALPQAYPLPCAHAVSYRAWLWGAIGRVLITFLFSLIWIILDGLWWGAWVVGTRNIGWRGSAWRNSVPVPSSWRPRSRSMANEAHPGEYHADDTPEESEGERKRELKDTGLWSRVRLLSSASKVSARSGRSGLREKARDSSSIAPTVQPVERIDLASPTDPMSSRTSIDPLGVTSPGADSVTSPTSKHKVRRKPVKPPSPPSSAYFPSTFEPVPLERQALSASRRPSAHESFGGSTVVGSPLNQSYLPSSPPLSGSSHIGHGAEDIVLGRRSMGLEILPELDREGSGSAMQEQQPSQPSTRPASRLDQYDDNGVYGRRYSPPTPPSPHSSYPPSSYRPSWTADMQPFSPVNSPDPDDPLLGHSYFMVGDGGFSAGTSNEGAYDEESYYRAMGSENPANRIGAGSPSSERSISPTSYGHGHLPPLDVRVETPSNEGDGEEAAGDSRFNATGSRVPWYIQHSSTNTSTPPPLIPTTSQHPLAQGIQMAMGRPEPFEREVRMLGGVVRRMSTIESFGSHERELELSRRGSAGTGRTNQTNQTGRGNNAAREGTAGSTSGSGSGSGSGNSNHGRRPGTAGSGSAEHSAEKTTEEEQIVRATSPSELSPS